MTTTNSRSQLMSYFGLPAFRAPNASIPVDQFQSKSRPSTPPIGASISFMPDNYIIEQDHRFIKRRIRPMLRFKAFTAAASVPADIELVNMIRKGQFTPGFRPFQQFAQLEG